MRVLKFESYKNARSKRQQQFSPYWITPQIGVLKRSNILYF